MRDHVARMRTLGFRYSHEYRFLQFDRFLQQRPGAENESLSTLVHEYTAVAPSAAGKLQRIHLGRVLAKALNRTESAIELEAGPCPSAGEIAPAMPTLYLQHGADSPTA